MNLKDIIIDDQTRSMLNTLGKLDRAEGIDKITGWSKIAQEMGYSQDRTPAREAYEDGYYGAA